MGLDRECAKPSPLTALMVLSSAVFMCGASVDLSLAGKIRSGRT